MAIPSCSVVVVFIEGVPSRLWLFLLRDSDRRTVDFFLREINKLLIPLSTILEPIPLNGFLPPLLGRVELVGGWLGSLGIGDPSLGFLSFGGKYALC